MQIAGIIFTTRLQELCGKHVDKGTAEVADLMAQETQLKSTGSRNTLMTCWCTVIPLKVVFGHRPIFFK